MANSSQFEVNFFKPKSEATKANTKLISILVLIWFVAVFGFQFLLIGVSKPVESKILKDFNVLWPEVQSRAGEEELKSFARTMLFTLGKNQTVKEAHRTMFRRALSVTVHLLDPQARTAEDAIEAIALGDKGFDFLLAEQLRFHYEAGDETSYSGLSGLPEAMSLYHTHNRSFLTDTSLFRFPLHYYYTAQFLLILFIVLCLVYARVTDKLNKRLGIEEE